VNVPIDRRRMIGALGAASLGGLLDSSLASRLLAQDAAPMRAPSQPMTVVMVHAAWADGSNWQLVIPPLARHGLAVTCAPLPLTSLSDDIAALQRAVDRTTGPVILVGHAYSGAVIGAIHDDRVKALVYVAALAPAEGETVADVFYRDPKPPQSPKLAPDANGLVWMSDDGVQNALAQNATADQKRIMAAVQRPLAVQCIKEKAPAPAWPAKPVWFLVAEEDRMINPKTQQFEAQRMNAHVTSLRVDHSPQVSAPSHVVDVIMAAQSAV
jgi:pimeloyl-ACP methyl ester carboxylesterase